MHPRLRPRHNAEQPSTDPLAARFASGTARGAGRLLPNLQAESQWKVLACNGAGQVPIARAAPPLGSAALIGQAGARQEAPGTGPPDGRNIRRDSKHRAANGAPPGTRRCMTGARVSTLSTASRAARLLVGWLRSSNQTSGRAGGCGRLRGLWLLSAIQKGRLRTAWDWTGLGQPGPACFLRDYILAGLSRSAVTLRPPARLCSRPVKPGRRGWMGWTRLPSAERPPRPVDAFCCLLRAQMHGAPRRPVYAARCFVRHGEMAGCSATQKECSPRVRNRRGAAGLACLGR